MHSPRKFRAGLVVTVALGSAACNPRPSVQSAQDAPSPQSTQVPGPGEAPPMNLPVGNPPPPPICPPTAPDTGAPCAPNGHRCGYPACNMPNHIMATCNEGFWAVVMGTCNPPPPPEPPVPQVPTRNPPAPPR